jgi:hypothetical protein
LFLVGLTSNPSGATTRSVLAFSTVRPSRNPSRQSGHACIIVSVSLEVAALGCGAENRRATCEGVANAGRCPSGASDGNARSHHGCCSRAYARRPRRCLCKHQLHLLVILLRKSASETTSVISDDRLRIALDVWLTLMRERPTSRELATAQEPRCRRTSQRTSVCPSVSDP